ncbi:MAG: hypothetical protein JWM80_6381 [Cyanobacteria bacterium RYN_339]|nr:hypothetical protein [Cyanobacteria bacterium RYN_339]
MRAGVTILGLGMLLLAGCGTHGGGFPQTQVPALPPTEVNLPGTFQAGSPDEQAISLTFAMAKAVKALPGASYEAVTYCRGKLGARPKGLPELADGNWEATSTAVETFRAPAEYKVERANDGDPRTSGFKLHITGIAVELRAPGWRGAFAGHTELADPSMLDFRGQRRDATDFAGLARRLGGAASARYLGTEDLAGATLDLVEIPRGPREDAQITREVLGLDANTHLPLLVRRYVGKALVFQRALKTLNVAAHVPAAELAI